MDEEKRYKRELAKWWVLVAIAVLFGGAVIWWDASERDELDARLEALIEDSRKMRAEVEEMAAKVEEMRQRVARERSSP